MKIYLDDERPTPDGWIGVRWPDEVIAHLETGLVTDVSLDHDLGDDERGTGYDSCTVAGGGCGAAWICATSDVGAFC